jgi:hypothetical protein
MQIAELLVIQNEQRCGVKGGFHPLHPIFIPSFQQFTANLQDDIS